jgi:hypothetical protein
MKPYLGAIAIAVPILVASATAGPALAQKSGGILKMYSPDSPASMSIHEEATVFAEGPMMGVFNNLVMFDQHVPQNSLQSIVPDLATGWSWNEEGTELTLPLYQGQKTAEIGCPPESSGSQWTRRWREMDSNARSPVKGTMVFENARLTSPARLLPRERPTVRSPYLLRPANLSADKRRPVPLEFDAMRHVDLNAASRPLFAWLLLHETMSKPSKLGGKGCRSRCPSVVEAHQLRHGSACAAGRVILAELQRPVRHVPARPAEAPPPRVTPACAAGTVRCCSPRQGRALELP